MSTWSPSSIINVSSSFFFIIYISLASMVISWHICAHFSSCRPSLALCFLSFLLITRIEQFVEVKVLKNFPSFLFFTLFFNFLRTFLFGFLSFCNLFLIWFWWANSFSNPLSSFITLRRDSKLVYQLWKVVTAPFLIFNHVLTILITSKRIDCNHFLLSKIIISFRRCLLIQLILDLSSFSRGFLSFTSINWAFCIVVFLRCAFNFEAWW